MSMAKATGKMAPLAACVIAMAVPPVAQAAAKSYVLRHPKREHCRAHYMRKIKKVRIRQHGKIVAVAETLCIVTPPKAPPAPVAPTPTPTPTPTPAPNPTPTPTPTPTLTSSVTSLEVGPAENCGFLAGGSGLQYAYCYYRVKVSVSSVGGQALNLPPPTYTFTNAGEPGRSWSAESNGNSSFVVEIMSDNERNQTLVCGGEIATMCLYPTNSIAAANGLSRWSMQASYGGTATFAPSQSASQTFTSLYF